jgi:RNA polymerase sigma factor (sigma-70 family)
MMDEKQLLGAYARECSESAFGELVTRHIDFVYSTALRVVNGDSHLAQDVTQIVFIELAREAGSLPGDVALPGWLYRHTCYTATKVVRTEQRRQSREQMAMEMRALDDKTRPEWELVAPYLDESLNQLSAPDRDAIVLRFLKQQDLRTVGAALGITDDAAQKRLSRALEKLRELLAGRGVSLTAAALASLLAAEAVTAAPPGLALSVATAALTAAASGGTTLTVLKLLTMAKTKAAIASAVVVTGAVLFLLIQHSSQAKLREENDSLRQQVESLSQLPGENVRLSNLVAQASNPPTNDHLNELLRLRSQVGILWAEAAQLKEVRRTNGPLEVAIAKNGQPQEAAKLSDATLVVWQLLDYETTNPNSPVLPRVEEIESFLKKYDPRFTGTNAFERVYQGSIGSIAVTNGHQVLVVREKQAWQGIDGGWRKAYGFGDSHAEIHLAADGDFTAWEAPRMASPPPRVP